MCLSPCYLAFIILLALFFAFPVIRKDFSIIYIFIGIAGLFTLYGVFKSLYIYFHGKAGDEKFIEDQARRWPTLYGKYYERYLKKRGRTVPTQNVFSVA